MSYRLIDANALNEVLSNNDYEKVLNAPCIFADLPNELDGENYNLQKPILDKIKAEIKELISNRGFLSCSIDYIHEKIDAIFDKYEIESEE